MRKRGQANIGGFIALIAFFLLVYVILLNPAEKSQLFGTEQGVPGQEIAPGTEIQLRTLLSVTPGFLRPTTQNLVIQTFPTVELFSNVESEKVDLANSISVSRSLFSNNFKEFEFRIDEPRKIDSVNILFLVQSSSGKLVLSMNGKEFFNGRVDTIDLPILIPRNLLGKDNVLRLETSSPGWAFLSKDFYDLENVQLVIKTLQQNKKESRTFVLTEDEYGNLGKATLFYFINCIKVKEIGLLNIFVNERLISSRLVACDAKPVEQDMSIGELRIGRNEIRFEIDKGEYALEQVVLHKDMKQKGFPQYYFAVQRNDIEEIRTLGADAVLRMEFLDDGYRKSGTVIVNGERIYFDTYGPGFEYDISDIVREGENIVKIIPKTEVEILSLDVILR